MDAIGGGTMPLDVGDCNPFDGVAVRTASSLDIDFTRDGVLTALDELPVIVGDDCVLVALLGLRFKAFAGDGDSYCD